MKKKLLSGIAMLLGCLMLVGCGGPKDTSVSDIQTRGTLRVAVPDSESVLLYQNEEGEYEGMESEIVDIIASALGTDVEYIKVSNATLSKSLEMGEADIAIGSLVYDQSYYTELQPSIVYGGDYVYVISEKGVYVGSLSVFEGQTVGVSSMIPSISKIKIYGIENAELIDYNNTNSVRNALDNGEIAGYFCYQKEAEELIADGHYQVQNAVNMDREEYVVLTPAGSGALRNGIDVILSQYLAGEYEVIDDGTEEETEE